MIRNLCLSLLLAPAILFAEDSTPEPDLPSIETVTESIVNAARFYRTHLAYGGGYGTEWPEDLSETHVEGRSSRSIISIQPPGTPTVGLAMLRAWQTTERPVFLQAAKEAAQSLIWCQLASGGWGSHFDFDPSHASRLHFRRDLEAGDTDLGKRSAQSTLDDNKTQSALFFLLELAHDPAMQNDPALQSALDFGMNGLLAAQAPNGGWPQRYSDPADPGLPLQPARFPESWPREFPAVDFTQFYTTNDGNLYHVLILLLRAQELEKDERYTLAINQLGEFLLLAQLPEPQRGWAQQYNFEMEPAWARKFEPPAVSSGETVSVLRTLFELWLTTGDERYRQSMKEGLAWLKHSQLDNGKWARFYELQTNRPLYCEAGTYQLTYEDTNTPTHYGFQVDLKERITRLEKDIATPRETLLEKRRPKTRSEKDHANRAKKQASRIRSILEAQHKSGYWKNDNTIQARLLEKNFEDLCTYLDFAKAAGEEFHELSPSSE
ncbi:MAG: pectate lyase [Verrucomicrobiota bacterium]